MSDCPGLHCPGCGSKGSLVAVGGAAAVVALAVTFATEILVIAGTVVGTVLALVVFFLVRAWRHGSRPSLNPVVAYTPLPEPEPRALPAPQEFHLHLHGPLTREQLDGLAAIREAGYRVYDSYRSER